MTDIVRSRSGVALRLISGSREVQAPAFLQPASRRPGDRHDAWPVDLAMWSALTELAAAGARHGLGLNGAATLVVERELVLRDLRELLGDAGSAAQVVDALDVSARVAERRVALGGPCSDYLRFLLRASRRRSPVVPVSRADRGSVLALPLRLLDRLDNATVKRALEEANLAMALHWEVAATAAGQMMSEWAAWQAAAFATRLRSA